MRAGVLVLGLVGCGPLYAEDLEGLWVHVQDRLVEAIEFEGGDEGLVVLDRPYRLWRYPLDAEDTQEVQRGVYEVIPRRYRDSTLIRTVEWDVDYTLIAVVVIPPHLFDELFSTQNSAGMPSQCV